jgi:hypothetical protein
MMPKDRNYNEYATCVGQHAKPCVKVPCDIEDTWVLKGYLLRICDMICMSNLEISGSKLTSSIGNFMNHVIRFKQYDGSKEYINPDENEIVAPSEV